ncbi:MAG: HNH endonuclease [Deltaproteobacteria bacterium]|nr:HNH endonuclease [Deltaproteobacteria bacterium]
MAGYAVRAPALGKRGYKWVYRESKERKLEVDHLVPRAKGGSNRPSNLVLALASGKRKKSDKPAKEFLAKEPEKLTRRQSQANRPRKDAAAGNITRWALWNKVQAFGLPMTLGNGAQT